MKSKKNVLIILFLSCCSVIVAQSPVKEKFEVNNDIGYAEAVKVGNTIYISGSAGWGNMSEAMRRAYKGIENALKHYNATFENVVKENVYTVALDSVIQHRDIRREFYKNNDYPAATWVEIKRLYNKDLVVEIEVVAVLREKE
jgi:enamine deaminase RidA (YjgF/YER057c/UK114 family)